MLKRRKNFGPTLFIILVLWGLLSLLIYFVEPEMVKDLLIKGLYLPFWLLFFPASFLTLAICFNNSQRGFVIALGITIFLILKIYQLGNLLNLCLIAGIIIAVDRYLSA